MVFGFLPMRYSKILFWPVFTIFCTEDSLITLLTAIINGKMLGLVYNFEVSNHFCGYICKPQHFICTSP